MLVPISWGCWVSGKRQGVHGVGPKYTAPSAIKNRPPKTLRSHEVSFKHNGTTWHGTPLLPESESDLAPSLAIHLSQVPDDNVGPTWPLATVCRRWAVMLLGLSSVPEPLHQKCWPGRNPFVAAQCPKQPHGLGFQVILPLIELQVIDPIRANALLSRSPH